MRREEADGQTAAFLEEEARRLDDLRRELACARGGGHESETLLESQRARVERREKRLGQTEESISDRTREIDEREAEIEARWARLEADSELRESKLEQREKHVGELELRLGKKESDLAQYVGQLQNQMEQRESDWWEKQLGKEVSPGCAAETLSAAPRGRADRPLGVSPGGTAKPSPSGVLARSTGFAGAPCAAIRRGARASARTPLPNAPFWARRPNRRSGRPGWRGRGVAFGMRSYRIFRRVMRGSAVATLTP